jgi:hypothetical protein
VNEARITGTNGTVLILRHPSTDSDGGWRYTADVEFVCGKAGVGIWDYGDPRLPKFFQDLADDWRGFDGVRSIVTIEGDLEISAEHDGLGTVHLKITIGQLWEPAWSLTISMDIGAGAHLASVAQDLERFFAAARPT